MEGDEEQLKFEFDKGVDVNQLFLPFAEQEIVKFGLKKEDNEEDSF